DEVGNLFIKPFDKYITDIVTLRILYTIIIILQSISLFTWFLLNFLYGGCVTIMRDEFSQFNKDFKLYVKKVSGIPDERFEQFRYRHQQLCELTDSVDDIFAPYVTLTFAISIPAICLTIYIIFTGSPDTVTYLTIIFMAVFHLAQICYIITYGALLNHHAHCCVADVYKMRLGGIKQDFVQLVQIFTQRLTGSPIGITCCSLFALDKPTILTLLGTVVT
ncbi:unnamed protein product, partial [Owenia fusiformis]